jgi:small redox-active disulfide protein 2
MKCNKLYDEVQNAMADTGISADLSKVEKIEEIMKFGVAFTPALVIDGNVKAAGKVPSHTEICSWLKEAAEAE